MRQLGLEFQIASYPIFEANSIQYTPPEMVMQNAYQKAKQVAARSGTGVIIGADTIVALDNQVFGKPRNEADAVRMLKALSGKTHTVYTGVSVVDVPHNRWNSRHLTTLVTFRPLDQKTINLYLATGEPLDKAGAYGIQGKGELLVDAIQGCYSNVVGLPLPLLAEMLLDFGISVW